MFLPLQKESVKGKGAKGKALVNALMIFEHELDEGWEDMKKAPAKQVEFSAVCERIRDSIKECCATLISDGILNSEDQKALQLWW